MNERRLKRKLNEDAIKNLARVHNLLAELNEIEKKLNHYGVLIKHIDIDFGNVLDNTINRHKKTITEMLNE